MTENFDQRVLRTIAIYKLIKCSALLLVAAAALEMTRVDAFDQVASWLRHLPLAEGHIGIHRAIESALSLTPKNVELIGAIAFGYALLFGVEGYGLWRGPGWAEYLTVVATASLIPFEIWALLEKMTVLRVAAIAVNILIVLWLWRMLRRKRALAELPISRRV